MRDSLQDEIRGLYRQFYELCNRIRGLPVGPVRMVLKQKRNALSGEIVKFRQMLIAEEVKREEPNHVPRVTFGFHPEMQHKQWKDDGRKVQIFMSDPK